MATNVLFDIFGDPTVHTIGLSVQSQVQQKGDKFVKDTPYLGKPYELKAVQEATGEDSIWGSSAGFLFEASQKADIDGCFPGNFATLDSIEVDILGNKTGVSMKVMFNPDADTTDSKLSKYMSDLKYFAYEKKTLRLKSGGTKEVKLYVSELEELVLRIGVPATYYIDNKPALDKLALWHTHKSRKGHNKMAVNQMSLRQKNGRDIPITTEFVSVPDTFFKAGQGELYEELKGAQIHGKRPGSFATIDKLKKDKSRIVSYKARDILKNYQGPDGLKRLANQLKDDIDDLAGFKSYHEPGRGGRKVEQDAYKEKRLSWAVPVMTNDQLSAFHDILMYAFSYAAHKNVMFRIHLVK
jgi:hypothetical protein